jgi:hypothetical protein
VNTAKPTITGDEPKAVEGNKLTAGNGTWSSPTPITYSYQWERCDANGANCQGTTGATQPTYTLTKDDVGKRVRVTVAAKNAAAVAFADSDAGPIVVGAPAPTLPAGAVKLADGTISIPVTSVSLPQRLVITRVEFSPNVVRSRNPFSARFRVRDTRGYVVRDALVYLIGLPYGRIAQPGEQRTAQDGWATFQLNPTAKFPLQRGAALVMFVRARKESDSLLAGVSTRRLVQVRISTPS